MKKRAQLIAVLLILLSFAGLHPAEIKAAAASAAELDRTVPPIPEPPFKGKIGRTTKDSKPDFPKEVQPSKRGAQYPIDHDR
ncbi:MAG: hypothetical protein PHD43_02315 [Methylococcales bacterium]|nr:hypothetical protein [Methylococcales bacterium]